MEQNYFKPSVDADIFNPGFIEVLTEPTFPEKRGRRVENNPQKNTEILEASLNGKSLGSFSYIQVKQAFNYMFSNNLLKYLKPMIRAWPGDTLVVEICKGGENYINISSIYHEVKSRASAVIDHFGEMAMRDELKVLRNLDLSQLPVYFQESVIEETYINLLGKIGGDEKLNNRLTDKTDKKEKFLKCLESYSLLINLSIMSDAGINCLKGYAQSNYTHSLGLGFNVPNVLVKLDYDRVKAVINILKESRLSEHIKGFEIHTKGIDLCDLLNTDLASFKKILPKCTRFVFRDKSLHGHFSQIRPECQTIRIDTTNLELRYCNISNILWNYFDYKKLKVLRLVETFLTVEDVRLLSKRDQFPSLKHVDLSKNDFSSEDMQASLEELLDKIRYTLLNFVLVQGNLTEIWMTNAERNFQPCKELRSLNLSKNAPVDDLLPRLIRVLPELNCFIGTFKIKKDEELQQHLQQLGILKEEKDSKLQIYHEPFGDN